MTPTRSLILPALAAAVILAGSAPVVHAAEEKPAAVEAPAVPPAPPGPPRARETMRRELHVKDSKLRVARHFTLRLGTAENLAKLAEWDALRPALESFGPLAIEPRDGGFAVLLGRFPSEELARKAADRLKQEQGIMTPEIETVELTEISPLARTIEGGRGQARVKFAPDAAEMARLEAMAGIDAEFIEDNVPELMEVVERVRERTGRTHEAVARVHEVESRVRDQARRLREAKLEDSEHYDKMLASVKAEAAVEKIAADLMKAPAAEREARHAELAKALEEAFDAAQAVRELEAQRVEKELTEIRRLLQLRQENRTIIIQRRMAELTNGVDPFQW